MSSPGSLLDGSVKDAGVTRSHHLKEALTKCRAGEGITHLNVLLHFGVAHAKHFGD
jgi:hypothetical protein